MNAVLFPGQGSQYVGMCSDFYEKFDIVKKNCFAKVFTFEMNNYELFKKLNINS